MVNGSFSFVEVNGDDVGFFFASFRKCDIIIIIGLKDNVEVVKEVLLVSEVYVLVVDLGGGLGGREIDCFFCFLFDIEIFELIGLFII